MLRVDAHLKSGKVETVAGNRGLPRERHRSVDGARGKLGTGL